MHDDTCPSSLQTSWKRLCASVREQLEEMAPHIPAMKPDELTAFVKVLEDTFFIAKRAEYMDSDIEMEINRPTPRDF
jgi:hypothetical protein